jgi:hypothetical protein
MKIGDRVRYLNAVGGGVITKFQDKNVVVVLEDDGFETPVLTRELVVIQETNQLNFPISEKNQSSLQNNNNEQNSVVEPQKYEFDDALETTQGEKLNLYLAFVPLNIKQLQTSEMDLYLINDSNYYIDFQLIKGKNHTQSVFSDTIEPQTKLFIEKITKEQVNNYEFTVVQGFAFKNNKTFDIKPAIDISLKINPVDFYKLHSFVENDYFDDNAMIVSVLENDFPPITNLIDPEALKKAMEEKRFQPTKKQFAPPKSIEIIEIDLHINELIDITNGLDNSDMLKIQMDKFNTVMKENIKHKGQKIVFIHGKGEGVLRKEIENQLKKFYKNCTFQDASFQQYGFGATQVIIR